MPKDADTILRLHARAQSKFKGRAFDLMRTALDNDKQFESFKKLLKEYEQITRRGFAEALVDTKIIETFDPTELSSLK